MNHPSINGKDGATRHRTQPHETGQPESQAPIAKGSAMAETRKLYRSRSNRQVAGVCGGLAEYFNLDATLIRILFVVLAVLGGSGLVLYLAMWIISPRSRQRRRDPAGDGSPHPCGTYGAARPRDMLDCMALRCRSLIRMG